MDSVYGRLERWADKTDDVTLERLLRDAMASLNDMGKLLVEAAEIMVRNLGAGDAV